MLKRPFEVPLLIHHQHLEYDVSTQEGRTGWRSEEAGRQVQVRGNERVVLEARSRREGDVRDVCAREGEELRERYIGSPCRGQSLRCRAPRAGTDEEGVQTAAKLYPAERLAALAVVAAELQAQYAALRAIKEAAAGQAPMETAEDGTPEEENSDDEDDEDEDIETSIARELAEIRAAKGSQFSLRRAPKTEDQDKGKVKDKAPRAPFIPVFTAIDCCE